MVKNILKYLISFGIAGFFFWLAFKDFTQDDFIKLTDILGRINYAMIALTLGVIFISHILRAWRWGVLLSTVKSTMSLRNLFDATMIGYAVFVVLSRVGEITKVVHLSTTEKIEKKKVFASVVVERLLDTLMFALLLALSVFIFRAQIHAAFGTVVLYGMTLSFEGAAYVMLLGALGLLGVFVMLSVYPRQFVTFIERIAEKVLPRWSEKIAATLESSLEGIAALSDRTKYWEIVGSSVGIWFFYVIAAMIPLFGLGIAQQYNMGFWETLAEMSVSSLGNLITPGGAGTYQYACTKALEKIFNVSLIEASGYALLTFVLNISSSLTIGGICFLLYQRRRTTEAGDVAVSPTSQKV
jgi:glycosyltransferase 2 family protein